MKKIKSLIASLMIITSLVAIPVGVNAEWRQLGDKWSYTEGINKVTGWKIINNIWYYFDSYGQMKTGWVYDSNKWYYMNGNGSWDNSKTTTQYPGELATAKVNINKYVNEEIKYFESTTINGKIIYIFVGSSIDSPNEYYYSPETGKALKLNQGIYTDIYTNELITKYSYSQCKEIADAFFTNSHQHGYRFNIKSDEVLNKNTSEYYFEFYNMSGQKIDSCYVNATTGNTRN